MKIPFVGRKDPLLEHLVSVENLTYAWRAIRSSTSARERGRSHFRRFEQDWPYEMAEIARSLRVGDYQVGPRRAFRVPKSSGGSRELTALGLRERLAQRAILQVLEEIADPKFTRFSFGFRPGMGIADALLSLHRLRLNGYTWAFHGDVKSCFESLDHGLLKHQLAGMVPSKTIRRLLVGFLASVGARRILRRVGVPQGAPLSPLLANIYLHPVDQAAINAGLKLIRYADDLVIATGSRKEALRAGRFMDRCLRRAKLRLNRSKVYVTRLDADFRFLGSRLGPGFLSDGDEMVSAFMETPHWFRRLHSPGRQR